MHGKLAVIQVTIVDVFVTFTKQYIFSNERKGEVNVLIGNNTMYINYKIVKNGYIGV